MTVHEQFMCGLIDVVGCCHNFSSGKTVVVNITQHFITAMQLRVHMKWNHLADALPRRVLRVGQRIEDHYFRFYSCSDVSRPRVDGQQKGRKADEGDEL